MKKIKSFLFFILSFVVVSSSYAQTWDAVGGGVNSIMLNSFPGGVFALTVYNNNLYVAGGFDSAGRIPTNFIAKWNGISWDSLNSEIWTGGLGGGSGAPYPTYALTIYNNTLCVGGTMSGVGQIMTGGVIDWNGTSWDSLVSGVNSVGAFINALTVYRGNLIAGGQFWITGWQFRVNIAQWNGTSWDSLGSGIYGYSLGSLNVYALAVYKGNLYAGGYFDSAGGKLAKNIAMWNGTSWSPVGIGINSYAVDALTIYNGKLYAGGGFDSAGGKPAKNIAVWDGNSWSAVGSGISGGVGALAVYGNILVAGGEFDSAGGIVCSNIAQWNDTAWSALGSGIGKTTKVKYNPAVVWSLCEYNGSLYVGGIFDSAGGMSINNIARWGPPQVTDTVQNYYGPFTVFPNPSQGIFTIGLPSSATGGLVKVYDILGQEIYSTLLVKNTLNQINISNASAGVYLYRVIDENSNLIGEGKLVIER